MRLHAHSLFTSFCLFPVLAFSAPVITDIPIPSQPLSVLLDFKQVDHSSSTTTGHSLGSPNSDIFTKSLTISPHVSAASQPGLDKLLNSPLQWTLDELWTSLNNLPDEKSRPASLIKDAIQRAEPKAYAITPTLPPKGNLYAGIEPINTVFNGIRYTGNRLILTYKLPGITSTFNLPNPLVGNWADPRLRMTFEGHLVVKLDFPDDPTAPMSVFTEFRAINARTLEDTFWSGLERVVTDIGKSIVGVFTGGSTVTIPIAGTRNVFSIPGLFAGLAEALKAAGGFGFNKVDVNIVQPSGQAVSNRIEIVVSHPSVAGPTLGSTGTGSNIKSSIAIEPNQVHGGDRVVIKGKTEAVQRSTTVELFGAVRLPKRVEVEYGVSVIFAPPVGPIQGIGRRQIIQPIRNPPKTVAKQTLNTNERGLVTITGLKSDTLYGVRARTYDVQGIIATEWGKWYYFRTADSDISKIEIVNPSGAVIASANANIDQLGVFSTSITLPAGIPAGNYKAKASIPSKDPTETPFIVLASTTPLTPTIYSRDLTGAETSLKMVWQNRPFTFYGRNWGPAGAVEVFMEGRKVGEAWTTIAWPPASPGGTWQADLTFPDIGDQSGRPHEVVAKQKSTGLEARCQIFYETLH